LASETLAGNEKRKTEFLRLNQNRAPQKTSMDSSSPSQPEQPIEKLGLSPDLLYFVSRIGYQVSSAVSSIRTPAQKEALDICIDALARETGVLARGGFFRDQEQIKLARDMSRLAELWSHRASPRLSMADKQLLAGIAGAADSIGIAGISNQIAESIAPGRLALFWATLAEMEKRLGAGKEKQVKEKNDEEEKQVTSKASPMTTVPQDLKCSCQYTRQSTAASKRTIVCSTPALFVEGEGDHSGLKTCQKHHLLIARQTLEGKGVKSAVAPKGPNAEQMARLVANRKSNTSSQPAPTPSSDDEPPPLIDDLGETICPPAKFVVKESANDEPPPLVDYLGNCRVFREGGLHCPKDACHLSGKEQLPVCQEHHDELIDLVRPAAKVGPPPLIKDYGQCRTGALGPGPRCQNAACHLYGKNQLPVCQQHHNALLSLEGKTSQLFDVPKETPGASQCLAMDALNGMILRCSEPHIGPGPGVCDRHHRLIVKQESAVEMRETPLMRCSIPGCPESGTVRDILACSNSNLLCPQHWEDVREMRNLMFSAPPGVQRECINLFCEKSAVKTVRGSLFCADHDKAFHGLKESVAENDD
jgi:hypothetical protein